MTSITQHWKQVDPSWKEWLEYISFGWQTIWLFLTLNKLKSLKVAKLKDEDGCEGDDDGGDEGCDEDGDEGWMIDSERLGGLLTD